MRVAVLATLVIAGASLGGCKPAYNAMADGLPWGSSHYSSVGIYAPGESWRQLVTAEAAKPPPADRAEHADDQALIVVQDSRTGDIRVCGDMTGYCVGMNPWSHPADQFAPTRLREHVPDPDDQAPTDGPKAVVPASDAQPGR